MSLEKGKQELEFDIEKLLSPLTVYRKCFPSFSATCSLTRYKILWTMSTTSMWNLRRILGTAATGRAVLEKEEGLMPGDEIIRWGHIRYSVLKPTFYVCFLLAGTKCSFTYALTPMRNHTVVPPATRASHAWRTSRYTTARIQVCLAPN